MAFTDELAFYLFSISFSALLLAYLMADAYWAYRKGQMSLKPMLESLSITMAIVAVYTLIIGVVSQFMWFLPGPYNILFFDPLVAFGIIMLAFSLSIRLRVKTSYAGFLSLMFGGMTIWYGISSYSLGLTKEPFELLALFILFGLAAIFTFPASLILDKFPKRKIDMPMSWNILLAVLWILLIAAGIVAFIIGGAALPGHLASPP